MLRKLYRKIVFKLIAVLVSLTAEHEQHELLIAQENLKRRLAFCGNSVRFLGSILITRPEKVKLGNNVHIGENAFFKTEGGLVIEDNAHISRNCTIYTFNHNYNGSCLPYDNSLIYKAVHIGKNVWIGMNVSIVPGVSIGEGAIIGIGSVVSRDVEPLAIVGGNPATVLKHRNRDHYEMLDRNEKYGGIMGKPLPIESIKEFKKP